MKKSIIIKLTLLFSLSSCFLQNEIIPLTSTHLAGLDVSKKIASLPFLHAQVHKKVPRGLYKKVLIENIKISDEAIDSWADSFGVVISSQGSYIEESKEIAGYFKKRLIEDIKNNNPDFEIVTTPDENTVRISIVIIELVYSKPSLEAGSVLTPVPGTGLAISALNNVHIAFVMRIQDALTGELIASIADRKFPPMKIVDFNKFTVTSSIKEICDNWSSMITKTFLVGHHSKVEREGDFSIIPW